MQKRQKRQNRQNRQKRHKKQMRAEEGGRGSRGRRGRKDRRGRRGRRSRCTSHLSSSAVIAIYIHICVLWSGLILVERHCYVCQYTYNVPSPMKIGQWQKIKMSFIFKEDVQGASSLLNIFTCAVKWAHFCIKKGIVMCVSTLAMCLGQWYSDQWQNIYMSLIFQEYV